MIACVGSRSSSAAERPVDERGPVGRVGRALVACLATPVALGTFRLDPYARTGRLGFRGWWAESRAWWGARGGRRLAVYADHALAPVFARMHTMRPGQPAEPAWRDSAVATDLTPHSLRSPPERDRTGHLIALARRVTKRNLIGTLTHSVDGFPHEKTPPERLSGSFRIAGAGLIPKPATGPAAQGTLAERPSATVIAHRIEEWWPLGREVGWLRELGGGDA